MGHCPSFTTGTIVLGASVVVWKSVVVTSVVGVSSTGGNAIASYAFAAAADSWLGDSVARGVADE